MLNSRNKGGETYRKIDRLKDRQIDRKRELVIQYIGLVYEDKIRD